MENNKINLDEKFNVENVDLDKSLQALKTFIDDVAENIDDQEMYQETRKMLEQIESKQEFKSKK